VGKGEQSDGSAWTNENNSQLLRGGSWSYSPLNCRSSSRDRDVRDNRYSNCGFRVVCAPLSGHAPDKRTILTGLNTQLDILRY
jgi:hypothetical protein